MGTASTGSGATNLIANALKYSPGGQPVSEGIRREEAMVNIAVRDEGIGIPEDEQGQLVEPFGHSETVRRSVSGIGHGLFTTRQRMEQHGGCISVASEPGMGTTVTMQLPVVAPSIADEDDPATQKPQNGPAHSPGRG